MKIKIKKELEKQRQLLFNERLTLKKNSLAMQEQLRHSQASGSKQPLGGGGGFFSSSGNTRIISSAEYQQQQIQQHTPVRPLGQEEGDNDPVMMNL